MKSTFLFILLFLLPTAFASGQRHLKTSNNDLRVNKLVLSIEGLSGKSGSFSILKTAADEYFFDKVFKKKIERIKISDVAAQRYDEYFVSQFISLKYSMPVFSGKNCSKIYSLTMRSERQNICKSEKVKIAKISEMIKRIESLNN